MKKDLLYIATLLCLLSISFIAKATIRPTYLRVEYKINPFLDDRKPRLSWELVAEGFDNKQTAYQIIVASSSEKLNKGVGDLWDSKKVASNQTNQVYYKGAALKSGQQVWWKVRVWNQDGVAGRWSDNARWEMGKLDESAWRAKWVGKDLNHLAKGGAYELPPSPYLRKEAVLTKPVKEARLYISSLGIHNFYINGEKVGDDFFSSGWTDYNKRVYYQVYDVTTKVKKGNNAFGAILGTGWYAGYLGYALLVGTPQVNQFYGKFPMLKAQIEIVYQDGSRETVSTDKSWKWGLGNVQEADMLQGERYDARQLSTKWSMVGFNDSKWEPIGEFENKPGQLLQLYPGEPVRVVKELSAKTIKKVGQNKYIVDFGQNFAGIIRLKQRGIAGDSLVFRYGEMLHPDGSLVTENLRKARATDTYIFRGDSNAEQWEPSFTYHGFQFVEISGLKEEPKPDFLTGLAMSSDLHEAGQFQTDNSLLNQLYQNIVWTQRANYLDIPTDCPQRDERLGWTGDAQVYMRSAIFNNDIAAFHKKWIQDLSDAQWENGAYPIYAPIPKNKAGFAAIRPSDSFSPGWSEAGIICAYEVFKAYGDHEVVKQSYPNMLRFMEFLKGRTTNHIFPEGAFADIEPKGGFGDWLSVGKKTSPDLIASIYYFYCNKLMREMSAAIGRKEEADYFDTEMKASQARFKARYIAADGKLKTQDSLYGDGSGYVEGQGGFSGHTQTAYANAIYAGILSPEGEKQAGAYLQELITANGGRLATGFLGFKPLLPALSKVGASDQAYKLILSTEYPSLGYEIVNGATSIWERWDSYIKGKGFVHNAAMNSFSHYAFGSVNEWMFENILGIKSLENGYRKIVVRPEIGQNGIKKASGSYRSINGLIQSAWEIQGAHVVQEVDIPVNTSALCYVRAASPKDILLNGKPLDRTFLRDRVTQEGEEIILKLGSGKYIIKSIFSLP